MTRAPSIAIVAACLVAWLAGCDGSAVPNADGSAGASGGGGGRGGRGGSVGSGGVAGTGGASGAGGGGTGGSGGIGGGGGGMSGAGGAGATAGTGGASGGTGGASGSGGGGTVGTGGGGATGGMSGTGGGGGRGGATGGTGSGGATGGAAGGSGGGTTGTGGTGGTGGGGTGGAGGTGGGASVCSSGATGTRVVRFRWTGQGTGSTASVVYEANTLPDTSRWHVSAASASIGFTPVFVDTALAQGGLDLEGTTFIDIEISTAGLAAIDLATLAIYGRSYNTTTSGSFTWQTAAGTGAAPTNLVSNTAPYRWYGADATAAIRPGSATALIRVRAGPSSNALAVNRVEICFDAR